MQGEVWRDVLDMTTADARGIEEVNRDRFFGNREVADQGGLFAYIPGIRSADAESLDKAQTIVRQTTARTHRR